MKNRIPSYRLHRASGLAVVTLGGKDHYLGQHGSEESLAEYRRLTALYVANGMSMPAPKGMIIVNELLVRFYAHAQTYYRKAGQPTSQVRMYRTVCRKMRDLFGTADVATLGSASMIALRESWVKDGNARVVVNRKLMAAKHVIDWGVEMGLVPGSVSHAARAVRGLARGRTTAPDREPIHPVEPDVIEATIARLKPRKAAMVRVQVLTGMRPGEVCAIRGRDVDRSGPVWIYRPASHKTEHHGRDRVIALGPQAQAVLGPWLDRAPPEAYVFSKSARSPARVDGYRHAIARAARAAGLDPWAPNRLRHNYATSVRRRFGLDAAQVVLGHARADVTQIYAELDLTRAAEIATAIG